MTHILANDGPTSDRDAGLRIVLNGRVYQGLRAENGEVYFELVPPTPCKASQDRAPTDTAPSNSPLLVDKRSDDSELSSKRSARRKVARETE